MTQRLGSGSAESAPDSIAVQLERDGQAVADDTVEPDYADLYPNGDACPPACYEGTAQFTF